MLAQTLQTLERDGLVAREVVTAIPPRVEYALTPLGARVAGQVRGLVELLEDAVPDGRRGPGRLRRPGGRRVAGRAAPRRRRRRPSGRGAAGDTPQRRRPRRSSGLGSLGASVRLTVRRSGSHRCGRKNLGRRCVGVEEGSQGIPPESPRHEPGGMFMTQSASLVAQSGTFAIGGDLPVHRLGYGAMQLTGPGVWGAAARPRRGDPRAAPRRRARRQPHRHRRLLRPVRRRAADPRGAAPLPRRPGDRHQGRPHPAGPGPVGAGRPARVPAPAGGAEPAPPRPRAHRPAPAAPHRPARCRWRTRSASSPSCRARARSGTSACPRSPVDEIEAGTEDRRRSSRCRTATTSPTAPPSDVLEHCEREDIAFIPWFPLATGELARAGGPLDADRRGARRDAAPARAGLAAAPLAGDAADPGHVVGGAPRGERRGRAASR